MLPVFLLPSQVRVGVGVPAVCWIMFFILYLVPAAGRESPAYAQSTDYTLTCFCEKRAKLGGGHPIKHAR